MGPTPIAGAHDPRPTGKLFALRWKHEYLRRILLGAILTFSIIVMFISLEHRASTKQVSIVEDGIPSVIQTRTTNVLALLEEQEIQLNVHDQLSVSMTDSLKDGSVIVIDRAKGITVQADGHEELKFTTADTVGEAVEALNLSLGSEDLISPSISTSVEEGMKVTVTRVKTEIIETSEPIGFSVVQEKNANLAEGKQKIVTTGQEGILIHKTMNTYKNGKLVSEKLVESVVSKEAVNQVVAVGTKKAQVSMLSYNGKPTAVEASVVNLNGKSVKVKRTLSNVTLTAYHAGFASTGKNKGDKGYGITASGTTVEEGRTIAVDPDVIPMGWWVYIEGIGFRRAEDTGSAIKGKKIDVFYESESYVNKFGKKRGYTVYVIGPVKPTAN
ncbi:MAG: G5 domain-containing protein [Candidatus Cohnella colombiensis]|uniref:G5 domain-containing protein n=1 Tax=Candidatus Cohnella colombiensis TaxID=3121368 RepID=A0AA95JFV3_9BACL|nr:MAG: G5 domain-containing protein [Cohnella sp.]